MTILANFTKNIDSKASQAFDKFVTGISHYDDTPVLIKQALRSFYIAGYLSGSAAGASATLETAKELTSGFYTSEAAKDAALSEDLR